MRRASFHRALIAVWALALAAVTVLPATAAAQRFQPEHTTIKIGLPVRASTFLPLYVAVEEGLFEQEGFESVELVAFRGGSDLIKGMVAGAVDMGVTSLAGVTVGINAGQDLKAFYGGFNMGVFDWYAVPEIEEWGDVEGARFGVSRYGSSTDFLTRYALRSRGLDPEGDVQIVQGGGSSSRLAAMQAGQLDVNIFAPPQKFIADDRGYNLVLRQRDLAPDYPFHVFFAFGEYIADNPDTIKAALRAHIRGVRLAKSDKHLAVHVLVDSLGMEEEYAERTYDDFIGDIYEDGRLPSDKGMEVFWQMGIQGGTFDEAWPRSRWWLDTYRDTYNQWKP